MVVSKSQLYPYGYGSLHKFFHELAHRPSPVIPLPALLTGFAFTGAGERAGTHVQLGSYLLIIGLTRAHRKWGVSVTMARPLRIHCGASFRELSERVETDWRNCRPGPTRVVCRRQTPELWSRQNRLFQVEFSSGQNILR